MPKILQVGRYHFSFFSNEIGEPPHIHVKANGNQAKFWLNPVKLASNYGFKAYELNKIKQIVWQYQTEFIEAWHEYFS